MRSLTRRDLGLLAGVVGLAAVARILYWVLVTPDWVPLTDADQYDELARNLAAGNGLSARYPQMFAHPSAFRPPGYPGLLGASYWVFGHHLVVGRALNLVLGVAVVALVVLLGRALAGMRAGVVAGVVAALYPPLLANDTVLLSEPLSLVFLAGMLLALTGRRWVIAAVLCGLLVLTRASAQFVVPVVVLWVLWQLGWRRALATAAIAAAVVAPWIIRNEVQLGHPVLVTSNGFNLAAMYSPEAQADGAFADPVFDPRFDRFRLAQFDEAEWQSELQADALDALKANPRYVLHVVREHALAYVELTPSYNEGAERADGRNLTFRSWTLPLFYVVTVVGVAGLVSRWRDPVVLLVLGLCAYFVASSLVLVFAPRLRAPVDLACCLGVGLAWARWGPGRDRSPTTPTATEEGEAADQPSRAAT